MPRRKTDSTSPASESPRRRVASQSVAPEPVRRVKSPALMIGLLVLGCGVTAGAVMLGKSDTGQIDVAAAVRQASLNGQIPTDGTSINVPEEAFRNMPNGGLVPQDGGASEAQPMQEESSDTLTTENATSTATTTPDGAPVDAGAAQEEATSEDASSENTPDQTDQSAENTPSDIQLQ